MRSAAVATQALLSISWFFGLADVALAEPPRATLRGWITAPGGEADERLLDSGYVFDTATTGVVGVVVTLGPVPRHLWPDRFTRPQVFDPVRVVVRNGKPQHRLVATWGPVPVEIENAGKGSVLYSMPGWAVLVREGERQVLPVLNPAQSPQVVDNMQTDEHFSVLVHDSPYLTTTDRRGRFEFTDVPQGEYRLQAYVAGLRLQGRFGADSPHLRQRENRATVVVDQADIDVGALQLVPRETP